MSDILSVFQDFDFAKILPEPEKFLNSLEGWARFLVLLIPLVLLIIGLCYRYLPKSRDHFPQGFRPRFDKRDPNAWAKAQEIAARAYLVVGGGLAGLMLVVSLFFNGKYALAMAVFALVCIVAELVLVLLLWQGIYKKVFQEK